MDATVNIQGTKILFLSAPSIVPRKGLLESGPEAVNQGHLAPVRLKDLLASWYKNTINWIGLMQVPLIRAL